jgi:hypothetical protein
MDFDVKTLEELRALGPRKAYDAVRWTSLQDPEEASEALQAALEQLVYEGILTWDQVEEFEES